MPKVMVLCSMASTYRFCPKVLGLMGLPLAVMQMQSLAMEVILSSHPSFTREITYRTLWSVRLSPLLIMASSAPMARAARPTFSGSPVSFRSDPRLKMVTPYSFSISLMFSSKLPNKATACSMRSMLMVCSNMHFPAFYFVENPQLPTDILSNPPFVSEPDRIYIRIL